MAQKIFTYKPQHKNDSKFPFLILIFGSQIFSSNLALFVSCCDQKWQIDLPNLVFKFPPQVRNLFQTNLKNEKELQKKPIKLSFSFLQFLPKFFFEIKKYMYHFNWSLPKICYSNAYRMTHIYTKTWRRQKQLWKLCQYRGTENWTVFFCWGSLRRSK